MGYRQVQVTVVASLSNHNSEQDQKDQEAWDDLVEAIKGLVQIAEEMDNLEVGVI